MRDSSEDRVPEDEVPVAQGFEKGQEVWVHGPDGTARPAIFVGEGENSVFFGGPPLVYVVMEDTKEGGEVELDRVTPR